jgi:glucose-1-phosphate adenylyltransferase
MMKNLMGVINLINEPDNLEALTVRRCLATVPFGGRYRLIDFALSSMVNSGIPKVAVFAHTKYRSLMDHLGSGKPWDLHHRHGGLFILPPAVDDISDYNKGDLYHFYRHRDYFHRSSMEYVVISRSHMVCNVNFTHVLNQHIESDADITMIYKNQHGPLFEKARRIEMQGPNRRVVCMQDHFGRLQSNDLSMEMYVLKKELLLDLVETSLAQGKEQFVRDTIMTQLGKLKVYGYKYEGYLGVVNTIPSYFYHSMQLLKPENRLQLFTEPGIIYTKVKDEPPSSYKDTAETSNSLIANGCIIEGKVENSILFRGAKISAGSVVKNSIIMQDGIIGPDSYLDHVILDKDVSIQNGQDLRGAKEFPFIAVKRKVI